MSQSVASGLGGPLADHLRGNFNELRFLLDTDEPFRMRDVDEHVNNAQMARLVVDGIVAVVDEIERGNIRYKLYEVREPVRDRLATMAAQSRLAPCGHRGIRNLGDGEYSCAHDDCEERFGRETAAAIVHGGEQ